MAILNKHGNKPLGKVSIHTFNPLSKDSGVNSKSFAFLSPQWDLSLLEEMQV